MLKGVATTLIVLGLIAICPMARSAWTPITTLIALAFPLLMVEIPKEIPGRELTDVSKGFRDA